MEIKLERLESMFMSGILTTIAFVSILWIKVNPLFAMASFGVAIAFWILFLFIGELIKSGSKKHEKKKIDR